MQPLRDTAWILPRTVGILELEQLLATNFSLHHALERNSTQHWVDSFDWRLFQEKRILFFDNNSWYLTNLKDRTRSTLHHTPTTLRFAQQFPKSPMGKTLKKILGVRALLEYGSLQMHSLSLDILNREGKSSLTILLQQASNRHSNRQLTFLYSRAAKHSTDHKQLAEILRDCGAVQKPAGKKLLALALKGAPRSPLDYSSKYSVPLSRDIQSSEAVQRIHGALLTTIQQNRQGVLDDIDPEFLHDMRVAIRRTRSALSLIKGGLSKELSDFLKVELRYLGQLTGPVRDLDVYLLKEEQYRGLLPPPLREGLNSFFETLALRRSKEQKRLVSALHGPRFQKILNDWQQRLSSDTATDHGENGTTPVTDLAGKIIHKLLRRILRDGKKIHTGSRDIELHKLRIQCKKLRYSLEFFASLYDPKLIKQFIRQLKMLQNNLGNLNDLSVQQGMLTTYLTDMEPASNRDLHLAAALGGLITELARQQQGLKTQFKETFHHFCRPENMALYHKIFG